MSTTKGNILLVDDEENMHEALKLNLNIEGYTVTSAFNGTQALKCIANEYFDLIVLDVMMPEVDGITVAETMRINNMDTPILMLSAKNASVDKVLGLKKGADDYLTKPFNLDELLLRIEKLITKNQKIQEKGGIGNTYSFGNNTIDFNAQTAINHEGNTIELSKKETMLLKLLVENKGDVVTREKILQVVWGYNIFPTTRTIDNFILSFRKNFETDSRNPEHFFSVRSVGYKFLD